MELLHSFLKPEFIWILVGLLLVMLEFVMPGLVVFFFGVGAIVTGVTCIFTDILLNTQLLIFIATSIGSLILLRRVIKDIFLGNALDDPDQALIKENIGKMVTALEDIEAGEMGKVEFHGTHWSAQSQESVSKGQTLVIIAQEGIVLKVKSKNS